MPAPRSLRDPRPAPAPAPAEAMKARTKRSRSGGRGAIARRAGVDPRQLLAGSVGVGAGRWRRGTKGWLPPGPRRVSRRRAPLLCFALLLQQLLESGAAFSLRMDEERGASSGPGHSVTGGLYNNLWQQSLSLKRDFFEMKLKRTQ
jgi:hypothetical protein